MFYSRFVDFRTRSEAGDSAGCNQWLKSATLNVTNKNSIRIAPPIPMPRTFPRRPQILTNRPGAGTTPRAAKAFRVSRRSRADRATSA